MTAIIRELPPAHREQAIASLAALLRHYLPGKPVEVRVRQVRRERSNLQARALWGCAYKALREQTGNDADDLHTYFCGEFFGWREYDLMGQRRKRPVRTTTTDEDGRRDVITTREMADFYEFIQRRSAEVGYDVPDPDPMWRFTEVSAA